MLGGFLVEDGKRKQRTTVSIYGQQYTIKSEETSEYVKSVASYVDLKMKDIKKHNPYLDTTKLAVLTAVNVVDEYMKLLKQLEDHQNLLEKDAKEEEKNNA